MALQCVHSVILGSPALDSAPRCVSPGLSQGKGHLLHLLADVPAALPDAAQKAGGHRCRSELVFPRIPGKSRGKQLFPRNNFSAKLFSSSCWSLCILCWTISPACPDPHEWQHNPLLCQLLLLGLCHLQTAGGLLPWPLAKPLNSTGPSINPWSAALGTGLQLDITVLIIIPWAPLLSQCVKFGFPLVDPC